MMKPGSFAMMELKKYDTLVNRTFIVVLKSNPQEDVFLRMESQSNNSLQVKLCKYKHGTLHAKNHFGTKDSLGVTDNTSLTSYLSRMKTFTAGLSGEYSGIFIGGPQ